MPSSGNNVPVTAPETMSDQPNILLIIADDQGLDSSAQYSLSDNPPVTPTIDALAVEGIVFDNVWRHRLVRQLEVRLLLVSTGLAQVCSILVMNCLQTR